MSGLAAVIGPDFHITGGPTRFLVTPLTLRAQEWCRANFKEGLVSKNGSSHSYSIYHDDIGDVTSDIKEAKMSVQWEYR